MKVVKSVDIWATDYLSKATKDYILGTGNPEIFPPQPTLQLVLDKSLTKVFSKNERENLVKILLKQYKNDEIKLSKTSKVFKNIILLENENVFSVTTGQQIHIFLGPLFFLYKIKSLLKIASEFNKQKTVNKVVPIFWMASEDHDFEEISSVKLYGKEYRWQAKQGNAVGRIACEGLPQLITSLEERADKTPLNNKMFSLFRKFYTPQNTLAKATRCILHDIFKDEGLIIINPDDDELKKVAVKTLKNELKNNVIFTKAKEQSELLKKSGYKPVLNPQKTNYFWLENGKRHKLKETNDGDFEIKEQKKISLNEISKTPEKLSPNVLSRAIYQETVLPNLVYVAGSTEIEYWLLLTKVFEKSGLQFPVLFLRDSAVILSEKTYNDIKKLKLNPEDFFESHKNILKKVSIEFGNKANEIEDELKKALKNAENLKTKMIDFGYEKIKVELNVKQLENVISKLKNFIQNEENLLNFSPSNDKLVKIKDKFFEAKQERIDFVIEYPELFDSISVTNFTEFTHKTHFLLR